MAAYARRATDFGGIAAKLALPASVTLLIFAVSYFVTAARSPVAEIGRMWFSADVGSINPPATVPVVAVGDVLYLQHEIKWLDDATTYLDYHVVDAKGKLHPYAERKTPKPTLSDIGEMRLHSRQFEVPRLAPGKACYGGTLRSYRWPWDWWQWPGPVKLQLPPAICFTVIVR